MDKLLKIIKNKNQELYLKIKEVLENDNTSKQLVEKRQELSVLKLRYENQVEHNSIIDGYSDIILNLKNHLKDKIFRFILIGTKKAFVFYTDSTESQILGYYELTV